MVKHSTLRVQFGTVAAFTQRAATFQRKGITVCTGIPLTTITEHGRVCGRAPVKVLMLGDEEQKDNTKGTENRKEKNKTSVNGAHGMCLNQRSTTIIVRTRSH